MAVRIGELLLKEKRITPEQLQEALNFQRQHGGKLGYNLIKLGFVKDEEITALLSKQYGVPSIALAQFEIDPAVIKLVPADTAHPTDSFCRPPMPAARNCTVFHRNVDGTALALSAPVRRHCGAILKETEL